MGEWISVEDRLPDPGVEVLVFEKWCDTPFIAYLHLEYGWMLNTDFCEVRGDACLDDNITQNDCTHWMPLPEPPK